jgi:homoserine O-acetyltransferase
MVWHSPTEIYDGVVEHHVIKIGDFTTVNDAVIKNVQVGYETTGTLNKDRSNAILIPAPVTGSSHFAGSSKRNPRVNHGYWDSIIGPGKPLDTNKYFLVSVEALCAIAAEDHCEDVGHERLTTGPASIDPDTGKPYGKTFPLIQFRDLVHVQKRVLDELKITKLHAVAGFSAGGAQALEWAAAPPLPVERVVSVAALAWPTPYGMAKVSAWREAIMLDPKWKEGNYYDSPEGPPIHGLALAFRLFLTDITGPSEFDNKFGRRWADSEKDPALAMEHKYGVYQHLDSKAAKNAATIDANSFMYMTRALEAFSLGITRENREGAPRLQDAAELITVPVLLVSSKNDQLALPSYVKRTAQILEGQGKYVKHFELEGDRGHMNGTFALTSPGVEENRRKAKKLMKTFLSNELLEIDQEEAMAS